MQSRNWLRSLESAMPEGLFRANSRACCRRSGQIWLKNLSSSVRSYVGCADRLRVEIASPSGCGYYEFDIENLRSKECRWLCYEIFIRTINNEVKIHYQLHSSCSMGDLSGILEMKD